MDKQEYLKSSVTCNDELDAKKESSCLSKQMISHLYASSSF